MFRWFKMPKMMLLLFLQICWLSYSWISVQSDDCRELQFKSAMVGYYLQGHVFKIIKVQKESQCVAKCYVESNCVSFNIVSSLVNGTMMCELSNSDHEMHPETLLRRLGSIYQPFENACLKTPCPPHSTCQNGFTDKGYRCIKNKEKTQVASTQGTQWLQTTKGPQTTQEAQVTQEPQASQALHTNQQTQTTQASQTTVMSQTDQAPLTTIEQQTTQVPQATVESQTSQTPQANQQPTQSTQASKTIVGTHRDQAPLTTIGLENTQVPQATAEPQTSQVPQPNQQQLTQTIQAPQTTATSLPTIRLQTTQGPQATEEIQTSQVPQTSQQQLTQTTQASQTSQMSQTYQVRLTNTKGPQTTQAIQATQPSVWHPETCGIVKTNLNDGSGWYVIDPDGMEGEAPFQVYCNMTDKGGIGVTVVSHDTENRTHVTGCNDGGCYSRNVKYNGVSFSQLTALTDVSTYCEQFISYECRHSKLLKDGKAWWMSGHGLRMDYWGGSSESGRCGCAVNGTCANSNTKCNCDENDDVWREDSGLLSVKNHLPVSQLRFGDTRGKHEEGYHTLGKLKCY